jgi:hypothetical protein
MRAPARAMANAAARPISVSAGLGTQPTLAGAKSHRRSKIQDIGRLVCALAHRHDTRSQVILRGLLFPPPHTPFVIPEFL